MELGMTETSFNHWGVQLILCCNICTIVMYLQSGDYRENITSVNISLASRCRLTWDKVVYSCLLLAIFPILQYICPQMSFGVAITKLLKLKNMLLIYFCIKCMTALKMIWGMTIVFGSYRYEEVHVFSEVLFYNKVWLNFQIESTCIANIVTDKLIMKIKLP